MKMKNKLTVSIIAAMIIFGLSTGSALAVVTCSDATIVNAGVFPGQADPATGKSAYRVSLTCNDDSPAWTGTRFFYLTSDLGDSGYATALTGYSLGKHVRADIMSKVKNSLIYYLHLLP